MAKMSKKIIKKAMKHIKRYDKKLEESNRRKYNIIGGQPYQFPSKNVIYISSANSLKHELGKCVVGYMLNKWGDASWSPELSKALRDADKVVKGLMKEFSRQKRSFITEACLKKSDRRIDVVRLFDHQFFELETKNIDKEDCVTFYLK